MELKSSENNEGHYKLVFKGETEEEEVEIPVQFFVDWKLNFKYSISNPVPVPYDFKKILLSIPVHIPKANKRVLFKACMTYLIQQTDMPAQVETVIHPGYPLSVITFDPKVIEKEDMRGFIVKVMNAIEKAEPNVTEKPKQPESEKDPLDDVDEQTIIEFEDEFDEELKKAGLDKPNTIKIEPDEENEEFPVYGGILEGESDD